MKRINAVQRALDMILNRLLKQGSFGSNRNPVLRGSVCSIVVIVTIIQIQRHRFRIMASTGLIRDDESPPAYESPIDSILLKMRRQNPVAAAVSTGYPYSSTHVNLDESILENWMAEPYSYYDGSNHNPTIHSSSSKPGFPTHQEALLQSTPKLRFISPRRNRSSSAVEAEAVFKSRRYSSVSLSRSRVSIDITYVDTLEKIRIDEMAGEKLASVLTTLAHEMTNENYNVTESQVFSDVFALVHSSEKEQRMAGIAAITALLDVPSADDEKKAIKFANTLSKSLRTGNRDYEFIVLVTRALGKMAFRTANVDLVEAEVTRCLEWLDTERSDRKYVRFPHCSVTLTSVLGLLQPSALSNWLCVLPPRSILRQTKLRKGEVALAYSWIECFKVFMTCNQLFVVVPQMLLRST